MIPATIPELAPERTHEAGAAAESADPAPSGGQLIARLRAETATLHARLESLVDLMSPAVTRQQYTAFLRVLWGFHSAVEQQLRTLASLPAVVTDLDERFKSALLEQDLRALGAALPAGPGAGGRLAAPALNGLEQALGTMYVLEGSTLGGQHLYRHLAGLLPETVAEASRFLKCYGANTGRMWNAFRGQLELAEPQLNTDAVIDAARASFIVLMDWFSGQVGGSVEERSA